MTEAAARYPGLAGAGVFITGGATGIGAAMVEAFAAQGCRVAFNDIDEAAGQALATACGPDVHFLHADASDADALQASVRAGAARLGRLDVLINNVANDRRESFDTITPQGWRDNLAVNLDPVFFASQAAAPFLRAAGGGAIVNFSSLNALLGPAELPTYTAAKAAIIGLTKSMARALGADGIRVNAIVPGWISTPRQRRLWLTPEADAAWKAQCCLRIDIAPEDVAQLALFLASPAARAITSQSFVIDGGRV